MQIFFYIAIFIVIIMYIVFATRTRKLMKGINSIKYGLTSSAIVNLNYENMRTTIQTHYKQVITTGNTILFEAEGLSLVAAPIEKNKMLLGIQPTEDEIKEFSELENLLDESREKT